MHLGFLQEIASLLATIAAALLAVHLALRRRLVLAGVCLACFFALLRPGVVFAGERCTPTRCADGDTLTFIRDGEKIRVRLAGYDTPERGQPFSQIATRNLLDLTEGGADCNCHKLDRHGCSVCTVQTLAGETWLQSCCKPAWAA